MKIPFDVKYRPQIESGEYKVVDKTNNTLHFDREADGVFYFTVRYPEKEYDTEREYDHPENHLFLITPEPELSEFTLTLRNAMADTIALAEGKDDDETSEIADKQAKRYAAELLAIARKEILKNLPRWSTNSDPNFKPGKYFCVGNALISPQGWSILFKDLEKLPGFKEDEK